MSEAGVAGDNSALMPFTPDFECERSVAERGECAIALLFGRGGGAISVESGSGDMESASEAS